jgi:hypothetical protein
MRPDERDLGEEIRGHLRQEDAGNTVENVYY